METVSHYFPVKQEQPPCNVGYPPMQNYMPPPPFNHSAMPSSGYDTGTLMHEPLGLGAPNHQMSLGNTGAKKPRKRPVKKEVKAEPGSDPSMLLMNGELPIKQVKQEKITDHMKVKKKRDRFKGMTEEEVLKRVLPDHLAHDLDIIIVGINPGLTAAFVGHHYAGPGNHFWKCLFLSGLIPEQMNAYQDFKLLDHGIGFTNIVERTSRGSADLTRKEIKEGGEILKKKIQQYKPKIAVFNGKGIYEVFCGHKNFSFGRQPEPFPDTDALVYVMPSSSARCTQLPRAIDKVPFYNALRKLRDHIRGRLPELDPSEVIFPDVFLKTAVKVKTEVKTEPGEEGKQSVEGGANGNSESQTQAQTPKKKRGRKPKVKQEAPDGTNGGANGLYMPHGLPQGPADPSFTLSSLNQGGSWLQAIPNINELPSSGNGAPPRLPQGLFQPQFYDPNAHSNGSQGAGSSASSSQTPFQVPPASFMPTGGPMVPAQNFTSASTVPPQSWPIPSQGFPQCPPYTNQYPGNQFSGQLWQPQFSHSQSRDCSPQPGYSQPGSAVPNPMFGQQQQQSQQGFDQSQAGFSQSSSDQAQQQSSSAPRS